MKKIIKITLTVFIFLSCVLPYINPIKVKALQSTYTYAYIDTDDLSTRTCPSTSCDRVRHDEGGISGIMIYISLFELLKESKKYLIFILGIIFMFFILKI